MSFVKRRIDVIISLGKGRLGDVEGPAFTLSGYRVSVDIPVHGPSASTKMNLKIYGLNQEMMNRLTTIGPVMEERREKNLVTVLAWDDLNVRRLVYEGSINTAWANYERVADGVLEVEAQVASAKELKPVPARSFPGAARVQSIVRDIAASLGYGFENHGVDSVLVNPYFRGTDMDQLRSCAQAARISFTIDRGVLSIWPASGSRIGDPIAISADTGLIGYPTFSSDGVQFKTLYSSDLALGKRLQVISVIEAAHGEWTIVSLSHKLDAEAPDGSWLSRITCKRNLDA